MEMMRYTALGAEFMAAISATFFFYKYRNTTLALLLLLLWYIPLNELIAGFYNTQTGNSNAIFFNIYNILVCLCILWITQSEINNERRKKIVKIIFLTSVVAFFINTITVNPLIDRIIIAYVFSSVLIVIAVLYFLIDLLHAKHVVSIEKNLFFWIAIGFLVFHIAYPVIYFTRVFIAYDNFEYMKPLYFIQGTIVIISYLTIAFGFYWGEKRAVNIKEQN